LIRKKLIDCVRPGVELVRAKPFTPTKLLIRLDLPTFERPAKTTSGRLSFGNDSGYWAAAINFALVIFNCYSDEWPQSHGVTEQEIEVETLKA
jgi:hypothetical protein